METTKQKKNVSFSNNPESQRRGKPPRSSIKMTKKILEKLSGDEVTTDMLQDASRLFNANYGVWGHGAPAIIGPFACEGTPVKISKTSMRSQYLPAGADGTYVRISVNGVLAGHVFGCRWTHEGKNVCWVTQLVVDRNYREAGLATQLLRELREDDDDVVGIMSSHPAACLATAKAFDSSMEAISIDYIASNARGIMDKSPIAYIREAKLRGSIFGHGNTDDIVCCADTDFFVDHSEPLEALESAKKRGDWKLGNLVDGSSFFSYLRFALPRVRKLSKLVTYK